MAFSMRSILGGSILISLAVTSVACDDGTTPGGTGGTSTVTGGSGNTGGSGTGTGGTGTGTGGGGTVEGTSIFDGAGAWIDGTSNTVGVQGSFFVLEDSVKDGTPVTGDGLTHTDLTPDTFGETTEKPCVSGTVALVTGEAGATCDPAGSDCLWSDLWGGGIGLNLNETGGEDSVKSALDLTAAGVTGFSFEVSGAVNGATVRFKVKDEANPTADFCTEVTAPGVNTVMLSELVHNCYQGGVASIEPDFSKAVQLEWQIVTSASSAYDVENFCIESVSVVTE